MVVFQFFPGPFGIIVPAGTPDLEILTIESPEILLFDDCLSAVDTETEEKILNNLMKITKGNLSFI